MSAGECLKADQTRQPIANLTAEPTSCWLEASVLLDLTCCPGWPLSLALLVRDGRDNGENCRFEGRGESGPRVDYLRQAASFMALNLCAYLCIGPFTILWSLLFISSL
jgi:hypothetical protein